MTRRLLLAVSASIAWLGIAHAQPTFQYTTEVGINIAAPDDYGVEFPFTNIMKYARPWISQNKMTVANGRNEWDTGVIDQIPMDENGYPLKLPYPVPGTETEQIVVSVYHHFGRLPDGRYVLLYDGSGTLDVRGDARVVSSSPGRVVIDLTSPANGENIVILYIRSSIEGSHVRNFRLVRAKNEQTFEDRKWDEDWTNKLAPFTTVRFMDAGRTNDSELSKWEDRPRVGDFTYGFGWPYEEMVSVANDLGKDIWVCIPHLADDEFIREMARLFRDGVDADRKIYVELSNELWNFMFAQTDHFHDAGDQNVPWPERIVPFIQNALDIWTEEFQGQLHRLERIVGVQASWVDVSERIARNMRPGSFDALAPAAYFALHEEQTNTFTSSTTVAEVADAARLDFTRAGTYGYLLEQADLASELGVRLVFYEGGQHLTPHPFGSEQPYGDALMAIQDDPIMYDLYSDWLALLEPLGDDLLFMHFSFMRRKSARSGSWGALEHQFEQQSPYADAPKYRALMDYIYQGSQWVGTEPDAAAMGLRPAQNFPNPFSDRTTVRFHVHEPGRIRLVVYDLLGREIATILDEYRSSGKYQVDWRPLHAPSGLYFGVLRAGEHEEIVLMGLVR